MKLCKTCKVEKPLNDFYTYSTIGCVKHLNSCKNCHNFREKKPVGFFKLDLEIQSQLKELVQNRQLTIADIAKRMNVNYANLCNWIKKGHLKPDSAIPI